MKNIEEMLLFSIIGFLIFLLIVVSKLPWFSYRWKLLLSIILTFQGVSIALLANKIPWYAGVILSLVAGWQLLILLKTRSEDLPVSNMGTRFMNQITEPNNLTRWFPIIGLIIAIADVLANAFLFNGRFGSNDGVVLMAAAMWSAYVYIPDSYFRERDFIFIFINLLVLVLVVPIVVYNSFISGTSDGVMSLGELRSVELLLSIPLENLLNLMGFEAFAIDDQLHYRMVDGNLGIVSIAYGCSGLYSVAVFISAFAAFVATEYNQFDYRVSVLLFFGIIMAYFANLFRMAFIVIVGHYYGTVAMEWAHANTGWIIFLIWISIFWSIIFRILSPIETAEGTTEI